MYTPEILLSELQSANPTQKAIDIASILFLVTSYTYRNSESPCVQSDNCGDMQDFSYISFDRKLRIREVFTKEGNRVLVFSYFNPLYEKHEVASIKFKGFPIEDRYTLPFSYLYQKELQIWEDNGLVPYADISDMLRKAPCTPNQPTLRSGAVVSDKFYNRIVSVGQLANILGHMLGEWGDFYDISSTVSYIEKMYDDRISVYDLKLGECGVTPTLSTIGGEGTEVAIDTETLPHVIASSKHVHYTGDGRSVEMPWDLEPKEG